MNNEILSNATLNKDTNQDNAKFNILSLFTGKNLKIIIIVSIILIALILYLSVSNNSQTNTIKSSEIAEQKYQTSLEYCSALESKLERLLSQIDGAGEVKVMLSLDGSPELVYASDTDTKTSTNSNGTTTTTSSSPIIVSNSKGNDALILKENLPSVKGVIVVSTGASNIGVKLDILNSVSTLLDISIDKISVLKGI